LRDVWGDHERQRSHPLGLAAGVLERTLQLARPVWVVQQDSHEDLIDSGGRRLDCRSG
jgi:hypothetical protein